MDCTGSDQQMDEREKEEEKNRRLTGNATKNIVRAYVTRIYNFKELDVMI
jgi:hypothetical protein